MLRGAVRTAKAEFSAMWGERSGSLRMAVMSVRARKMKRSEMIASAGISHAAAEVVELVDGLLELLSQGREAERRRGRHFAGPARRLQRGRPGPGP